MVIHTWGRSPLNFDLHTLCTGDFWDLFWHVLHNLPEQGVILFSVIAWSLWKARHKHLFKNQILSPSQIFEQVVSLADELASRREGVQTKGGSRLTGMGWKPPPLGNSKGQPVLAGVTRCKAMKGNSTLIEALALRFGFEEESGHGLRIHILESDSKNLIDCLKGNLQGDTATSLIVGDILDKADGLVAGSFISWDVMLTGLVIVCRTLTQT
ncbi:hypothetical protein ACS0TY_003676 [Phlomoides rotata]